MNRNVFKYIAAAAMFCDHVGEIMMPYGSVAYIVLKSIGRLAYVMFAYMIAEGFFHTRNIGRYFLRLLSFAIVIEIFFLILFLAAGVNYTLFGASLNVFWPLVFGLGALWLISSKIIWIRFLSILVVVLAAVLNIQYGAYGVMIILTFGLYSNFFTQVLFLLGLNLIFIDVPLMHYLGMTQYTRYPAEYWFQWFSMLALAFIYFYNGKKGKVDTKWFFYIFYPAHIGLIFLINYLIQ